MTKLGTPIAGFLGGFSTGTLPHRLTMTVFSRRTVTALLLTFAAGGCGSDAATGPGSDADSDYEVATYRVTFEATWSAGTHPTDFPPGPHFSPLIGATHSADVAFWAEGGMATPGIRSMAETGGTSALATEVTEAITAGMADRVLLSGGIGTSPGEVTLTFDVRRDRPLVTLVSMIAPSPDWFVGVHDLSLRAADAWRDEVTITLVAWDAGTDSGPTYTSLNQATQPAAPIQRIQDGPLGGSAALGTFTFTRLPG